MATHAAQIDIDQDERRLQDEVAVWVDEAQGMPVQPAGCACQTAAQHEGDHLQAAGVHRHQLGGDFVLTDSDHPFT